MTIIDLELNGKSTLDLQLITKEIVNSTEPLTVNMLYSFEHIWNKSKNLLVIVFQMILKSPKNVTWNLVKEDDKKRKEIVSAIQMFLWHDATHNFGSETKMNIGSFCMD